VAVRVSVTVTNDDQRTYIKIELRGKTQSLPPPPPPPLPPPLLPHRKCFGGGGGGRVEVAVVGVAVTEFSCVMFQF
jgi:hypothetical protein